MNLLNFLVAIILAYISVFSNVIPPYTIPSYFYSTEGALMASQFYAVAFYWVGFMRNFIGKGSFNEQTYFIISFSLLVYMCASKIIFALPYTWISSMFAFGLGVLSVSRGQTINKKTMWIIAILSVIIFCYSSFILIGMAWFNFVPSDYYFYQILIQTWIVKTIHAVQALF